MQTDEVCSIQGLNKKDTEKYTSKIGSIIVANVKIKIDILFTKFFLNLFCRMLQKNT